MSDDVESLRILTVCSHNRTRSVMIAAMLQSMLDDRFGRGGAIVSSAGFGPPGLSAIPDAVAAMAARGLDVSGHRSTAITESVIDDADLVLTAERDHVVRIAMMSRQAFGRTMTLPEFLARGGDPIDVSADGFGNWVGQLTEDRPAEAYLRERVDEIADPTGTSRRVFTSAVDQMHDQCAMAADLVATHRRV
jgi:protein-tyrosine phosphatase